MFILEISAFSVEVDAGEKMVAANFSSEKSVCDIDA